MLDQYEQDVPGDLVLLPDPTDLEPGEIELVVGAAWYEVDGVLMASFEEIRGLSEDYPTEAGVFLDDAEILRVPQVLHRWSLGDGFYHA